MSSLIAAAGGGGKRKVAAGHLRCFFCDLHLAQATKGGYYYAQGAMLVVYEEAVV
jgi:hypothetical protein